MFTNLKDKGHHEYINARYKNNNNTMKHGIYGPQKTTAEKISSMGLI